MALLMDKEDVVTTTLRRLCTYNVTISCNKVKSHGWQQQLRWQMRGCSGSCVCGQEACCRRTGDAADRRHQQTAMARVVKTTTTRTMKKVRAMMARVTRAMAETSLREEGDNGHNNQLSTKVMAVVRTVVAIYER
jgi:hypothetical protein